MSAADRRSSAGPPARRSVGVGFKAEHFEPIRRNVARAWFFRSPRGELHGRGRSAASPPRRHSRAIIRFRCTASGCRSGPPGPLYWAHLARLARGRPGASSRRSFSEHLAWSTHQGAFFNDLLPLPYTVETLLAQVDRPTTRCKTPLAGRMLLENPSTYVSLCRKLCSPRPISCARSLAAERLRPFARYQQCLRQRLPITVTTLTAISPTFRFPRWGKSTSAGYAEDCDDAGLPLLIDAHNSPVRDPVWALYGALISAARGHADPDRMGQ